MRYRKFYPEALCLLFFSGNKPLISAYNISQYDFEALAKSMRSIPAIQRKVIKDIATIQALQTTDKEAKFWKGVAYGCNIK